MCYSDDGFWAALVGLLVYGFVIEPLLVMWLWNWLMPSLFGLTTIGFWQAFGLSWLCNLLFKTSVRASKD